MRNIRSYILLFVFIFLNAFVFSQKSLQILRTRFGKLQKIELFTDDVMEYKLKGERRYRRDLIVNMNDSLIMFKSDSIIKLSRISKIKLRDSNHLLHTFSSVFTMAGFGYVTLNGINNLILNGQLKVDRKALIISGSFLVAGFILKQLSIKRIKIRDNVVLKVIDINVEHLNPDPALPH